MRKIESGNGGSSDQVKILGKGSLQEFGKAAKKLGRAALAVFNADDKQFDGLLKEVDFHLDRGEKLASEYDRQSRGVIKK